MTRSAKALAEQEPVSFRALIEREYLAKGFTKHDAACLVKVQSGVSLQSQRAAFAGTRVAPQTARDLAAWAMQTHKAKLDIIGLMTAPTRARKSSAQ